MQVVDYGCSKRQDKPHENVLVLLSAPLQQNFMICSITLGPLEASLPCVLDGRMKQLSGDLDKFCAVMSPSRPARMRANRTTAHQNIYVVVVAAPTVQHSLLLSYARY